MLLLLQESLAPYGARTMPLPKRVGYQPARRIDPLVDRAMALASVGAWTCDLSNNELTWTSGVYQMFGLPLGERPDRTQAADMYTDESREAMERLRRHAITSGGSFLLDAQIVRSDGALRWMRINGEMIRHPDGASMLHGLKQDVTEEKLRWETLRCMAENDALTGLSNRAVYESQFLNRQGLTSPIVPLAALFLFDLDDFKGINDRFGHSAGDACLRVFAERLLASFPEALMTARIGGHEFALIFSDDGPVDLLAARVAIFLAELRAPITWREHVITVGATSGIAVPSDPYSYDPEEMFNLADAALYAAKTARRHD